jgi:thymidylate synthase (FAD)
MPYKQITATYLDHMGSDLTVVNAARVSFGKRSEWNPYYRDGPPLYEKDSNLIRYLASGMSAKDIEKWKTQMITANDPNTVMEAYNALAEAKPHLSPFGHCFASFHVKAPIFVRSQLVKHEYLRVNEISRRYVDSEPEFYVPDVWRGRTADKKQGSSGVSLWNHGQGTGYRDIEYEVMDSVMSLYLDMIAVGVAPEQARMVLPQSMMTEWWWSGSLDAFANMCNLRLPEDAQYESRLVAQQISDKMKDLFPVSWKALVPLA